MNKTEKQNARGRYAMNKTEKRNAGGRCATKRSVKYGASRWIALIALLSFLGWAYETGYMYLRSGKIYDRGFLTLPFCPIYGVSIAAAYLLLGVPDGGEGGENGALLRRIGGKWTRYALYVLFTFLIPSVAELAVGALFDRAFDVSLWDYTGIPLNVGGYVALPISLAWSLMLFVFMKFAFLPLKNMVGKLPKTPARILAVFLCVAVAIDFLINFGKII